MEHLRGGASGLFPRTPLARPRCSLDVEGYAATMGEVPAGLEALGTGERGRRLQDPWGHPYQVRRSDDPNLGPDVRVFSAGPDGRMGTPDDIALGDG